MQTFWLKFEDGSEAACDGQNAYDAVTIAEKVSGKKVAVPDDLKYRPEESDAVQTLPYPASPMIWEFDHPVHGVTPHFCYRPRECKGKRSCPQRRSCVD